MCNAGDEVPDHIRTTARQYMGQSAPSNYGQGFGLPMASRSAFKAEDESLHGLRAGGSTQWRNLEEAPPQWWNLKKTHQQMQLMLKGMTPRNPGMQDVNLEEALPQQRYLRQNQKRIQAEFRKMTLWILK